MKKYTLIDETNSSYLSDVPGVLGGHKKLKIYGRLDCPSALKWIDKGHYVNNRVFFLNEEVAIQAGYRPCAVCLPEKYHQWKQSNQDKKLELKRSKNE